MSQYWFRKWWHQAITWANVDPDPYRNIVSLGHNELTHWGWVTHICIGKLTIIGSDNGLSPGRRQAIIWTNAGILLIGPLGTNFSEVLSEIYTFSFKKMHLKMSSAKWRPFFLGLNVLTYWSLLRPENVLQEQGRHHGCWCPGSLYARSSTAMTLLTAPYMNPCLHWEGLQQPVTSKY